MPVKSQAQQGFMAMSRSARGRVMLRAHGKDPASHQVADEFMKSSKGMRMRNLPKRVRKKKT